MEFPNGFFTTPRTPLFIFSQSESELFLVLGADECANDWKTCRDNNFGAINPPVNESRASHDLLIFSFGEKQVVQYMYVCTFHRRLFCIKKGAE